MVVVEVAEAVEAVVVGGKRDHDDVTSSLEPVRTPFAFFSPAFLIPCDSLRADVSGAAAGSGDIERSLAVVTVEVAVVEVERESFVSHDQGDVTSLLSSLYTVFILDSLSLTFFFSLSFLLPILILFPLLISSCFSHAWTL